MDARQKSKGRLSLAMGVCSVLCPHLFIPAFTGILLGLYGLFLARKTRLEDNNAWCGWALSLLGIVLDAVQVVMVGLLGRA